MLIINLSLKGIPRSMPKAYFKEVRRLARCTYRAQQESGYVDKQLHDMFAYGQASYTPEQQEVDRKRALQLMKGLK